MAEPAEAPSRLARIGRALKPGFRPKRRDFAIMACVALFVLAPLVPWGFWRSPLVAFYMMIGTILFGFFPSSVLLAAYWQPKCHVHAVAARVALQAVLCIILVGPLLAVGRAVAEASIRETVRRGNVVVAAVAKYEKRHGRYPRSLADVESELGPLPKPSVGRRFYYTNSGDRFHLEFVYNLVSFSYYDSSIGKWIHVN